MPVPRHAVMIGMYSRYMGIGTPNKQMTLGCHGPSGWHLHCITEKLAYHDGESHAGPSNRMGRDDRVSRKRYLCIESSPCNLPASNGGSVVEDGGVSLRNGPRLR